MRVDVVLIFPLYIIILDTAIYFIQYVCLAFFGRKAGAKLGKLSINKDKG